ncbi:MAG: VanZ family protein [Ignavibacteria bacterium]|nr:VanZ family protein [Ignavibacteria bacterium]
MNKPQVRVALPVAIASAAIFVASGLPAPYTPDLGFDLQDKLYHAVAYHLYGITVLIFILGSWRNIERRQAIIWLLLFGGLYAVSDELHQAFVPTRHADTTDLVADWVGVASSIFWFSRIRWLVGRKFFS